MTWTQDGDVRSLMLNTNGVPVPRVTEIGTMWLDFSPALMYRFEASKKPQCSLCRFLVSFKIAVYSFTFSMLSLQRNRVSGKDGERC